MVYSRLTGYPPIADQMRNQRRCPTGATYLAPEPPPLPRAPPVLTPTARLLERLKQHDGDQILLSDLAADADVTCTVIRERLRMLETAQHIRILANAGGFTALVVGDNKIRLVPPRRHRKTERTGS